MAERFACVDCGCRWPSDVPPRDDDECPCCGGAFELEQVD